MSNIEQFNVVYKPQTKNSAYQEFSINTQNGYRGYLEYYFSRERNAWILEELHSDISGGGKALIQAFCQKVGVGQKIWSGIIEKETYETLIDRGTIPYFMSNDKRELILTNPEVLHCLKIVRVFQGGGLNIERFILEKCDTKNIVDAAHGYPVLLSIEGTT